jgi:hypothetical protein
MEITTRDLFTVLHGMGFGTLFMLAFSGALAQLYRSTSPGATAFMSKREQSLLAFYLVAMVIFAWVTVLSGAYIIYPWYRAVPPEGVVDLTQYPRRLLLSSGRTADWHNIGMEWKEHVSWMAPIAITAVAYISMKYKHSLAQRRNMRVGVLVFTLAAFTATAISGTFGAFLSKYAPVRGGSTITLIKGE